MTPPRGRLLAGLLVVGLCASTLGACSSSKSTSGSSALRILGGSEISDLAPVLKDAEKVIGRSITVSYTGTLDGAQQISSGAADGSYDAAWFSSNRYLSLLPDAGKRTGSATKIMSSPVIIGVRQSKARELGWDTTPPSWSDISEAAAAKRFTFAMTNPAASNTGFSALVGVATALSGTGSALTVGDVDAVAPKLEAFFSGQTLTAGSSGFLADAFATRQQGATPVDGLVNYESVLLSLNAKGSGEPLTLVYPSDGVVTADYPLTVLSSASEDKKALFDTLQAWLLEPAQQQRIMDSTRRRPLNPSVSLDPAFRSQVLVELPFPNQLQVADDLIGAYLNKIRRPAQTIFVLDTSGSMAGARIDSLREAMRNLAGADSSAEGAFARFRDRETVTVIAFSSKPQTPRTFQVPATDGDGVRTQISDAVSGLQPTGGTAVYSSLEQAYRVAQEQVVQQPEAFTSIVLMTDGESNQGDDVNDFRRAYRLLPADAQAVPVFTILFGEGDKGELQQVADLTGGKLFDAKSASLPSVFKDIRGYQ